MIKMKSGVFGLPVGNGIIEAKDKNSAPFEAGAEVEARLVKAGLAIYVTNPYAAMNGRQLKALLKERGLPFKIGMTNEDMIKALQGQQETDDKGAVSDAETAGDVTGAVGTPGEAHSSDESEDGDAETESEASSDEDAPTFDPAEAVQ